MIYLVTGVAGFIGFHVASQLCAAGHRVVGIDNLNDYYEVSLKETRLAQLASFPIFASSGWIWRIARRWRLSLPVMVSSG